MKKSIIKATALVALLSAGSMVHAANESSFSIKVGNFNLSEKTQAIGGFFITEYDDSSSSVFALEYEKQIKNNISWGGELINYSNDMIRINGIPVSGIGADTLLIMFNGKKYFDASKIVKPFIGAGIGVSTVSVNEASASGIAFQAMAGLKFSFKTFSALVEYKLVSSEAEDSVGDKVDVSGSGVFAGIAFNF